MTIKTELTLLLVEDDKQASKEMIACADTFDDITFTGATDNSTEAVALVHERLPHAIILDLELHNGSGSGLAFLHALKEHAPAKKPYIIVTTNNSSQITYDAARQAGADYIFYKHQADYSADTVLSFLQMLKKVILDNYMASGTASTQMIPSDSTKTTGTTGSAKSTKASLEADRHMIRRIHLELDQIGINPKVKGYQYLTDAIYLVMHTPPRNLCTKLAQTHGKTESSIQRAMQNAIAKAWRTAPIDDLLKFYTAKINSEKGVPTITEFVYYYANKLKNEYY